jgi:hypothetical protein
MTSGRTKALGAVLVVLAAWSTCAQTTQEWPTYRGADVPPHLQEAQQEGDLIIISLQSALLAELHRKVAAVGPAMALASCHIAGTAVARQLSRRGIDAGRTSARLRDPSNAPRPWAAGIVARYADQPAARVEGFVVDLGSRVGVLRPVREQVICASCHGPLESLRPDVRARLAERYPADRATGFREGDIHGWFWVELPRNPRQ